MKAFVKSITSRQQKVLRFINEFIQEHGYAPTLKDIANKIGNNATISLAQYYVNKLHQKGHLRKRENKQRGLTPISPENKIPLLGYIAAGAPIEPIENPEIISVPSTIHLDKRYQYYALKIKGDSMEDINIINDDTVIIKHQLTADDGDIVVGIVKGEATLKVLKFKKGKPYLESRNKNYKKIYPVDEIRGKFIGLIRNSN